MKRILVVDNEELLLDLLVAAAQAVFGKDTCIVVSCMDPFEAIGAIQQEPAFDLVITDFEMPKGEEGADVIRAAQEKSLGTYTILASGAVDKVRGLCRPDAIIRKPLRLGEITQAIEQVMGLKAA